MVTQRIALTILLCAGIAPAAGWGASITETATLKDLQTVGSTSKKQKHQQYDLVIDTAANEYTCRSRLGSKVKPTEFVVGSTIQFAINGQNGVAVNAAKKKIRCGIVRVAGAPSVQPPAQ